MNMQHPSLAAFLSNSPYHPMYTNTNKRAYTHGVLSGYICLRSSIHELKMYSFFFSKIVVCCPSIKTFNLDNYFTC